ncbi:hypothetical protein PSE_p0383 (plasmid) [Pseudovibrio sp. FO-BEG1]|nr:hypothetical protein [Pseudovibrio sp. FO-BEG1]AEV39965.1 hypothetical protein PSE_p0383 [Pseudovibrio sp. FO-BEG1]
MARRLRGLSGENQKAIATTQTQASPDTMAPYEICFYVMKS